MSRYSDVFVYCKHEEQPIEAEADLCNKCLPYLGFIKVDGPVYRPNYGTPDDGNTLGEKEYNEGEDAYHQINQLVRDGYLVEVGKDSTP